jgi:hypothetical protein
LTTAVVITGSGLLVYGQSQDPKESLQQKLNAQFALTQVTKDYSDIVSAGALVVLQKDGLLLNSIAVGVPRLNTYKKGKISQGFGGVLDKMVTVDNGAGTDQRQFAVGEKLWVIALGVQKNDIVFRLYSDPYDGTRYYGQLKFPFEKGSVPTPDQALATISEVLTVQQADTQANPQVAQAPSEGHSGHPSPVFGLYVQPQNEDAQLQLSPDGSFSERYPNGLVRSGSFTVSGDTLLTNTVLPTKGHATYNIQEDKLFLACCTDSPFWIRRRDRPVTPPAPVSQLKLPSTYVNVQTPADQLQLNADNSFSLKEAGQPYRGTFTVNGNTLELNITDGPKTTATIQGTNLTDSSGQTWSLREQSAGPAPSGAMLQNEDVIKMAKAGFDDSIIIAKIGSSRCQFDTSTDALILLKQSGVSAAVIRAIVTGK